MVIEVESGMVRRCHSGATVWLTGLPSAGKTTIAQSLAEHLREELRRVAVPDETEVRHSVLEAHRQDLSESTAAAYGALLLRGPS